MVERPVVCSIDVYNEHKQLVRRIDFERLSECSQYILELPRLWDVEIHFYNPSVH